MSTITTIGSLNTDLILTAPHFPHPGETLTSTSFTTAAGGKGLNQCLATRRLSPDGFEIKMVGCVGSDEFAGGVLSALEGEGVDVAGVRTVAGGTTGVAVVTVDARSGENHIVLHSGANGEVAAEAFGEGYFEREPTELVVLQLEIPLGTVLRVVESAREAGVDVMFNPAPAVPLPAEVYSKVKYLIVNETEAAILAGVEVGILDSKAGVKGVAETLVGRGAGNAVITLGSRGCYWVTKGGEDGFVRVQTRKEDVVDTTGAGDTFVGALAVAVTEGKGMRESVEFAAKAAGIAVTRRGAVAGIPWRREVEDL